MVFWLVARVTVSLCSLRWDPAIGGQEGEAGGDRVDSRGMGRDQEQENSQQLLKGGVDRGARVGFKPGYRKRKHKVERYGRPSLLEQKHRADVAQFSGTG